MTSAERSRDYRLRRSLGQVKPIGLDDDRQYSADETEFIMAMDRLKRKRPFPTCRDVLAVVRSLGYIKVP